MTAAIFSSFLPQFDSIKTSTNQELHKTMKATYYLRELYLYSQGLRIKYISVLKLTILDSC